MRHIFWLTYLIISTASLRAQVFTPTIRQEAEHVDEVAYVHDPLAFQVAVLNDVNSQLLKLEKLELGVTLPAEFNYKVENFVNKTSRDSNELVNPYLEWELKVQAVFFHESGTDSIVVDGFYMKSFTSYMKKALPNPCNGQAYSDEEYNKLGGWREIRQDHPFRIRFAPPMSGNWIYYVRITTPQLDLRSEEMTFKVAESSNPGYMGVTANGRFLQLDGKTFYPIGMNAPWPESHAEFDPEFYKYHTSTDNGTTYYRPELYRMGVCVPRVYDKYKETLGKMADAGVNYIRTIMSPVSTEIEWETLGDYTKRLSQAQELDAILELAEERDMYIHWDLASHFTFKYNVYSIVFWDWIDSDGTPSYAYKSALKLDHPTDFFTNEEARRYYKQRLRYILARWGYSTNIAAFELICEISNIGSQLDDNDAYYHDHHQLYEDWQVEMGNYIKSQYNGKTHLLTASYSGPKHPDDHTFSSGAYDIMTSNVYDFNQPDFSSFFTRFIAGSILDENPENAGRNVYTMPCTGEGENLNCSWNIKPMLFSETDPLQTLSNCERSPVELNRSVWQSLFSGLAASLSWSAWYFTDNYATYGQMRDFISSVDLGRENWHPGASMLVPSDSMQLWQYNASYAASMDSPTGKADLSYLRSGQRDAAIGVITNKTYNIYNADNCLAIPPSLGHLKERQAVSLSEEKLKVKGLQKGRYRIQYFLPENQHEPIYISDQKGSTLDIDLPLLSATKEGYIVLFRISRID